MSENPTLEELRIAAEEAAQKLRDAEAVEAARPPISLEEAKGIFEGAIVAHKEAQAPQEKHDITNTALLALEKGKHRGPMIDILAQHVLDAREALSTREAPPAAAAASIDTKEV